MTNTINIRGARLHNLKNISLEIPKNQLVVLSGVSGSGKSTLGFDILFKEGQRLYMEALGWIPFGLAKAPVEVITGLSPTISVDQRLTNQSPRSTVGTSTEVFTFLRLLFARLGRRPCRSCGKEVPPLFDLANLPWEEIPTAVDEEPPPEGTFPCPHCGAPVSELSMAHFSFNKPVGACPTCTGLGSLHQANLARLVDEQKSLLDGAVYGWNVNYLHYNLAVLRAAANYYGLEFDPSRPIKDYTQEQRDLLFYGVESPSFRQRFPDLQPPTTVRLGRFEGLAASLLRRYAERITDAAYREKMEELLLTQPCPDCRGTRLRAESRSVTVNGQSIVDLARLPVSELGAWLQALPAALTAAEMRLAGAVLADLTARIARLVEVGLGYLSLERASPSLSAGEAQRLRLAALLGAQLSGVLYIFDEPTIGIHPYHTRRLIELLRRLRDLGNTVLVIEHDLEMIAAADMVIDFGPGAGKHGGQIVAVGMPGTIAANLASRTGDFLSGRVAIPVPQKRRPVSEKALTVTGARHHNLQNIDVRFPLGLLVAVTGVSGSGKSSLVFGILERAVRQHLVGSGEFPGAHGTLLGLEYIDKLIAVDQRRIGRLPRSNVATYTETFTPIRQAYAAAAEARQRRLTARHFSFNQPGGRCERCAGAGVLHVSMHFLPDVEVRCPACQGRRFTAETLAVRYREHDISQALDLTIEEALLLFEDLPAARSRLQALCDVGLGYLQLGQPADSLSGGEAQRVKLARELGRRSTARTLYLLDEPTTGLHPADIARLLGVLQRLVDAGGSAIVIEHNLELIKTADWIIDLGPEGGASGGRLVAEGAPEQVALAEASYTGQVLKQVL